MRASSLLALLTVASFGACVDDRASETARLFPCDPESRTADHDCGDGYVCYRAASPSGDPVCVPSCNPDDPTTCKTGECTAGGECLTACTVESSGGCGSDPAVECVRWSLTPDPTDGVCLRNPHVCASSNDCTSPVFNTCDSEVFFEMGQSTSGLGGFVCIEGGCSTESTSCEPGSVCLKRILPPNIPVPDVCSPECVPRTTATGETLRECPPGLMCLTDAFPGTTSHVCAPGFPNWLCTDDLGCFAGHCRPWAESILGKQLRACSPSCTSDDDCAPWDRSGNPDAITKMSCVGGSCRNLQSLFQAESCFATSAGCGLDPDAVCAPPPGSGPPPSDGGVPDGGATSGGPNCGVSTGMNPFGSLNMQAYTCQRSCTSDGDCAKMAATSHVPHACIGPPGHASCAPIVPFITPCQGTCFGDLACMPVAQRPFPVCTRACQSDGDCTGDAALGPPFACINHVCAAKTESGCVPPTPSANLCLSGKLDGTRCVSPTGWACDADVECMSGACNGGRCQ